MWISLNTFLIRFIEQRYFFLPFSNCLLDKSPFQSMKGKIEPTSALAEAKQPLVDYFMALAYRFSFYDPVTYCFVLKWGKKVPAKVLRFLKRRNNFFMNQQPIIRTSSLSYHYSKDVQTLYNINLRVERGSIYGFLGPNGRQNHHAFPAPRALNNQKGDIQIFGQHLHTNRKAILGKIGSLIEIPSLYGHLTAKENLEVDRNTYGVSKARVNLGAGNRWSHRFRK